MHRLDRHSLTRRRFLASAGVTSLAGWVAPRSWFNQLTAAPTADGVVEQFRQAAATGPMQTTRVRGNAWIVTGSGCNVVALARKDGVTLVDSGILGKRVSDTVKQFSRLPVTHLVNTHWHFDHTGGNDWLHRAGASILAHENTRKRLSVDTRVEGWVYTFPAAPAGAIPTTVFQDEHTVHFNGSTLALKHYAPSHTDSDISVHFTEADVLHTGDTFWNREYPFIDYSTGGSIDGQIRAAEANLAKVSATTIVIPGHGAVGGKADLTLFRDVLIEAREKVARLKKQGRTVEEVISAKPTAPYDAEWGQGFQSPKSFLGWVYQGV